MWIFSDIFSDIHRSSFTHMIQYIVICANFFVQVNKIFSYERIFKYILLHVLIDAYIVPCYLHPFHFQVYHAILCNLGFFFYPGLDSPRIIIVYRSKYR